MHLGYSWAQRRRGELGPLADVEVVNKLFAVCRELQPLKIVFLGDVVHAPRPCAEERSYIEDTLGKLATTAELFSVRGNHDRAFAKEFHHLKVTRAESWSDDLLLALHGDRLPENHLEGFTLVLGHLHPSMPVKDVAGAGRRLPVFLATNRCIVLPAFSPFARGFNLLDGLPVDFERLMGTGPVLGYVASGTRVVALGALQHAIARMFQADVSAPAVFRRRRG